MGTQLCLKCMNVYNDDLKYCPHCSSNSNTIPSIPQKKHYLCPGSILKKRYIVGFALRDNGNISYLSYDTKYNKKVIIQETYDEKYTKRSTNNNQLIAYSPKHAILFNELVTKNIATAQRLVSFHQKYSVGDYLKCFKENNTLYIVKEFLIGETLEQLLSETGSMPLDKALSIACKILNCFNAIHIAGMYHGHIQPTNIFIKNDGSFQILHPEFFQKQGRNIYSNKWNNTYSAPEMYTYHASTGPWSDIYSVAAILYKMITGENIPDAQNRLNGEGITEFSTFGIPMSRAFEIAIFNALALSPSERTSTIQEFRHNLLNSLSYQPKNAYNYNLSNKNLLASLCMGCMNQYDHTQYESCPYCGYNIHKPFSIPNAIEPGTIISERYVLGRDIGQGGFGITYIGYDLYKNMRIAIKEYFPKVAIRITVNPEWTSVEISNPRDKWVFNKGKQRILDEARMLQKVSFIPEVVHVFNCIRANNTVYIIMEYLEGETLMQRLTKSGRFAPSDAVSIIIEVLKIIKKVNDAGIIHMDIAPDNIMLLKNGSIKLFDFGASRYSNLLNYDSRCLKHGYAPIEQYISDGDIGPWTDVYSSAASLYQLITGIVPQKSIERKITDKVKRPSELGIAISKKLEFVIMNGLSIYQQNRIQNAEDFIKLLQSALIEEQKLQSNLKHKTADLVSKLFNKKNITSVLRGTEIEPNPTHHWQ